MPDKDGGDCDSDSQYSIGYKKPPSHTWFQPGMSGNAKGRPKGSRNFSNVIAKELDSKIDVTENGRRRKISKREAIVKQAVNKAASGDSKATIIVLNEARQYESNAQSVLGASFLITSEDQNVMANILRRIRQSDSVISGRESDSDSANAEPQTTPANVDSKEGDL
jgi:hypothetical protein